MRNVSNIQVISSHVEDNAYSKNICNVLAIFCHEITVKRNNSSAAAAIAKVKVAKSELSYAVESDEFLNSKYESEGELNRISDL